MFFINLLQSIAKLVTTQSCLFRHNAPEMSAKLKVWECSVEGASNLRGNYGNAPLQVVQRYVAKLKSRRDFKYFMSGRRFCNDGIQFDVPDVCGDCC